MKVKIIFDKERLDDRYFCGWGVSYLLNERILFDAGEEEKYILHNLKALKVDIKKIEKVVISHNRWDHLGGLWSLLERNKQITVFACLDFFEEFKNRAAGYNFKLVTSLCEIAKNIYTTGCISFKYKNKNSGEQALIVKTQRGLSIVCGCSRPGILAFVGKAKEAFPQDKIYSLLGGFHLMDKDERLARYVVNEIKKAGVKNIGPSHCTGFETGSIFKEVYPDNFWEIKAGKEIEL